ncbi:hypothetical protein TNCV_2949481 [Trichonephila clavipes]|nr:hypothetical protein TNCV_2949481 [Trichonephila clavipes]
MHLSPTRWVFSGTGLELVTRSATIRYLEHSATAAVVEARIEPVTQYKQLVFFTKWVCDPIPTEAIRDSLCLHECATLYIPIECVCCLDGVAQLKQCIDNSRYILEKDISTLEMCQRETASIVVMRGDLMMTDCLSQVPDGIFKCLLKPCGLKGTLGEY